MDPLKISIVNFVLYAPLFASYDSNFLSVYNLCFTLIITTNVTMFFHGTL